MRLRKLILSTGLAVAMVATTIPALGYVDNAGTDTAGLQKNGSGITAVDQGALTTAGEDFVGAYGLEEDAKVTVSGLTGTITNLSLNGGGISPANDMATLAEKNNNKLGKELGTNEYTYAEAKKVSNYVVTASYSVSKTVTLSGDGSLNVDNDKATIVQDIETKAGADVDLTKAQIATALAVKEETVDNLHETVAYVQDSGIYTAGTTDTKSSLKDAKVTVTETFTVTYTKDTVASGYAYDIIFDTAVADNKDYIAYAYDSENDDKIINISIQSFKLLDELNKLFEIINFGSYKTELSIEGSDIDISVQLLPNANGKYFEN